MIVLLLALLAQPDVEAAKDRAGQLITRGNQQFEAKKLEDALASFEEAYRTFPSPKIHYNLARTLAALQRTLEALEHYQSFLDDAGLAKDDARYLKAQEEMERLEDQIAKLAFVIDVKGSTLMLDDSPAMPVPEATIRVLPGAHEVVIETPDRRRFVEKIDVAAGETLRVHVLFPAPVAQPPPPPSLIAVQPVNEPEPEPEPDSIATKWWFWTLIGVAVVGAGVGIGVGVGTKNSGEFQREGELDITATSSWERL